MYENFHRNFVLSLVLSVFFRQNHRSEIKSREDYLEESPVTEGELKPRTTEKKPDRQTDGRQDPISPTTG